jgi:hypothetical protein
MQNPRINKYDARFSKSCFIKKTIKREEPNKVGLELQRLDKKISIWTMNVNGKDYYMTSKNSYVYNNPDCIHVVGLWNAKKGQIDFVYELNKKILLLQHKLSHKKSILSRLRISLGF